MKNIKYFYSVDMWESLGAILEVSKGDFISLEKKYRNQFDNLESEELEASYIFEDEGASIEFEHSRRMICLHRTLGLFTIKLYNEVCFEGYKFIGKKRVY